MSFFAGVVVIKLFKVRLTFFVRKRGGVKLFSAKKQITLEYVASIQVEYSVC